MKSLSEMMGIFFCTEKFPRPPPWAGMFLGTGWYYIAHEHHRRDIQTRGLFTLLITYLCLLTFVENIFKINLDYNDKSIIFVYENIKSSN